MKEMKFKKVLLILLIAILCCLGIIYYKIEKNDSGKIYFNVPVGWNNPHAYIKLKKGGEELLGSWPGTKLIKEKDYVYYFNIDGMAFKNLKKYYVTFNDGGQKGNYKLSETELKGFNKIYNPTSNLKAHTSKTTGEWLDYDSKTKVGLIPKTEQKVKNIILMIGDGMGLNHIKAGNIYKGEKLNIDKIADKILVTTNSNSSITDSAASSTAIATGYKTNNGYVGLNEKQEIIPNIFEFAKAKGKKTGVVVTQIISHATPAGFTAHVNAREKYDEIAKNQIEGQYDLLLGKGKEYFNNKLDLMKEKEIDYIENVDELDNLSISKKVIGAFDDSSVSLNDLTKKALKRLNNDNGFILMIEGSHIDTYSHSNDIKGMLKELIEFDDTVKTVQKFVDENPDTLLIVTADHETGGLDLNGITKKEELTNSLYTTVNHTDSMVGLYTYGKASKDLAKYTIIDNTSIFTFMKEAFSN